VRYIGGKHRLVKHLLPIMLEGVNPLLPWVEPFVGSGGVLAQVPFTHPRMGADTNPFMIALLEQVRDGWQPPENLDEAEWRRLRNHSRTANLHDLPAAERALIAFAGAGCSYASRWFEGYARDPRGGCNFAGNARRSLLRMAPLLTGAEFRCSDYRHLVLPRPPALLYCDPPYSDMTVPSSRYYPFGEFNSDEFWEWALDRAVEGYSVYVSEFRSPLASARVVWERDRAVSLTKNTGKRWKTDRLYRIVL
jgi:site-specific DNA-adenine methylase